ncbi:hypothetical protein [Oceanirhabdus sp. W0125-5]|uniref:hypothetical protein n=1 Tax=Oceanirhabdus sp. W0125-5 TaxID=2999116 RepID=UPI0022F3141D|nr:hypothetical protein [Oceanirhabdus sp. W0125-5]WBW96004.1 hypothetical protein OW730_20260 [Oceanirhabdus sp. W0125-5]
MRNLFRFPGPNSIYKIPGTLPAGFWSGLWHGLISPITLIISIFYPKVRMYETNNNIFLYDLGFLFGVLYTLRIIIGLTNNFV